MSVGLKYRIPISMSSLWESLVAVVSGARKDYDEDDSVVVIPPLRKGFFDVGEIVDRRKENGRVHFLVHWAGYPKSERTWEPRHRLVRDVPGLVREYERNQK